MEKSHEKFRDFVRVFWRYYKELEDEFLHTSRYVEIHKDNFYTYSIEYLKLFQAVCSEIDVLGKVIANEINPDFKDKMGHNIQFIDWWRQIHNLSVDFRSQAGNVKSIEESEVMLLDEIRLEPWSECNQGANKHFLWWDDYNSVKHARMTLVKKGDSEKENYTKANLGNVCNAFSGLYIMENAYMQLVGPEEDLEKFADYSKLFCKIENISCKEVDDMMANSIARNTMS